MPNIFSPRQLRRARSQKTSTVRIRNFECQQQGLAAGIRKIRGKWRLRKHRAKKYVKETSVYAQLHAKAPELCDKYMTQLEDEFNCLQRREIENISQLWNKSAFFSSSKLTDRLVQHRADAVTSISNPSSLNQAHSTTSTMLAIDTDDSKQTELTNLILNPPFAPRSGAYQAMKALMLTL